MSALNPTRGSLRMQISSPRLFLMHSFYMNYFIVEQLFYLDIIPPQNIRSPLLDQYGKQKVQMMPNTYKEANILCII